MAKLDLSLPHDREQLQQLLITSMTLLCRKVITFSSKLSIEGLLGITVDNQTVLLVNVNELLQSEGSVEQSINAEIKPDPGFNIGAKLTQSGSRRKSRVTRKAVVNLENDGYDGDSDLNTDWNTDYVEDMVSDTICEGPLNLVKAERTEYPEENCLLQALESNTHGHEPGPQREEPNPHRQEPTQHEQMELASEAEKPNDESSNTDIVCTPGVSTELSNSWPLPSMQQGNIRKYGSYGYIINQGTDVVFSCNQCPKIFRNRVSLWRHGVKHKMIQNTAQNKTLMLPASLNCVKTEPPGSNNNNNQSGHTYPNIKSAEVLVMQNNLMKFQNNLGIKSSPVSTYGVLCHYGKKSWYTCIVCQDKFMTRASLWRHKARHAVLNDQMEQADGLAFTATTGNTAQSATGDNSTSSASSPQDPSAIKDEALNGNCSTPDSHSPPSVEELHLDQNYNIPLPGDEKKKRVARSTSPVSRLPASETIAMVTKQQQISATRGLAADGVSVPPASSSKPGVLGSGMRMIGRYGYVVTMPDGKLYHCIDCSKSFRNRVSLWKHQAKHQ